MTVALCSTSAFYQQKNYEKLKGLGQTEAQAMKAALQGHLGFIKGSFQYLEEGEHLFDARLLGKFPKEYKVFKSGSKVKFVRQDFDSAYEVTLEGLEKYLTGVSMCSASSEKSTILSYNPCVVLRFMPRKLAAR